MFGPPQASSSGIKMVTSCANLVLDTTSPEDEKTLGEGQECFVVTDVFDGLLAILGQRQRICLSGG